MEKGRQDRYLPMTPDFSEFIPQTPKVERDGLVFKLPGAEADAGLSLKRICRVISAIGKKAGVIVNKTTVKYATAHDLRRSFGTAGRRE